MWSAIRTVEQELIHEQECLLSSNKVEMLWLVFYIPWVFVDRTTAFVVYNLVPAIRPWVCLPE